MKPSCEGNRLLSTFGLSLIYLDWILWKENHHIAHVRLTLRWSLRYRLSRTLACIHRPANLSSHLTRPVSHVHAGHLCSCTLQQSPYHQVQTTTAVMPSHSNPPIPFTVSCSHRITPNEIEIYHFSINIVYFKLADGESSDLVPNPLCCP